MDETKKPLRIPPSYSIYAEENGIFDLFKNLLSDVIVNKPDDPLAYILEWLKRDKIEVPQIAVIGPPLSGKTTVSRSLFKSINAVHIDQNELLKDANSSKVHYYLKRNEKVPDKIWVDLIKNRLKKKDCIKRGYVLEDFPRNRIQAISLQTHGILLKHLVVLDTSSMILIERHLGRRIDPRTGDVYHTTFDWPSDPEIQDRLVQDDGTAFPRNVTTELEDFARCIDDVISTYSHIYKKINADQPKTDVLTQTMTFINSKNRNNSPFTPRIILLGPTGSGKSSIAKKLSEKYGIIDVNCGKLIRQHISGETKLGKLAQQSLDDLNCIDDDIVRRIIVDRLAELDASVRGWVIHGYPVTRRQAENLSDACYRPNRVYFFDTPVASLIERLTGRLLDPVTGDRYHETQNPPETVEIRERCVQHPKDRESAVRDTLNTYKENYEELRDFYEDFKPIHINADQDFRSVMEYVESTIIKPLPDYQQNDAV